MFSLTEALLNSEADTRIVRLRQKNVLIRHRQQLDFDLFTFKLSQVAEEDEQEVEETEGATDATPQETIEGEGADTADQEGEAPEDTEEVDPETVATDAAEEEGAATEELACEPSPAPAPKEPVKTAKSTGVPVKSKRPAFAKPAAAKPAATTSSKCAPVEASAKPQATADPKPKMKKPAAKLVAKKSTGTTNSTEGADDKENAGDKSKAVKQEGGTSKPALKKADGPAKPQFKKPKAAKAAAGPPDPSTFSSKNSSKATVVKASDVKGKKGTASKESKPKAPRAMSSFMFFAKEQRPIIAGASSALLAQVAVVAPYSTLVLHVHTYSDRTQTHQASWHAAEEEGLSFTEVGKRLGEIWRGLSDKDKAPYNEQAAVDKARVEKLKADNPDAVMEEKKVSKKDKKSAKQKDTEEDAKMDVDEADGGSQEAEKKTAEKRKRKADKVCMPPACALWHLARLAARWR